MTHPQQGPLSSHFMGTHDQSHSKSRSRKLRSGPHFLAFGSRYFQPLPWLPLEVKPMQVLS